jgi:hypothetical protein
MALTEERPDGAPLKKARTDVNKALLGGATYRSLGQQQLSPGEEKFEKARRTTGFWLAPLVIVAFLLAPIDIPNNQQTLAAVLLGVIVLWITEPVPIPIGGLIGVGLIVLLGVVPANEALAPFGSSTVFTFIGAFILAQAMLKHGLARRFAFRMLRLPGVGGSTVGIVIAFGAITALLSAFVSNTATVAMLLPTAMGILAVIAKLLQDRGLVAEDFDPLRLRVGAALLLMLAYGASVGGLLTPVGSPPNLIGRGLIEEATGVRITFAQWIVMALPICLLMFLALATILLLLNRPEIRKIEGVHEYIAAEHAEMGRLSRAEKNTLIAFGVTVTLWMLPGVLALFLGNESSVYETVSGRLNEGIVAVLGASLLFPAADRLVAAAGHSGLERRGRYRLGHDRALRHGHHLRLAAGGHRPRQDTRYRRLGRARTGQHRGDHSLRRGPRHRDLRDDEQHRFGRSRRADHHPDRAGSRRQPVRARARCHLRSLVRLHAPGVDAAERDRLRLWRRADHHDDSVRHLVRRVRRDPHHDRAAADGRSRRAGVAASGDGLTEGSVRHGRSRD